MAPVKPKPLSRSLTFWSGILVTGFIGWAWRASILAPAMLYKGLFEIQNYDGTLYLGVLTDEFGTAEDQATWTSMDPPPEPELFPGPSIPDGIGEGLLRFGVVLPHWLLLLAVSIPWTGLLLWRARRIRRKGARPNKFA